MRLIGRLGAAGYQGGTLITVVRLAALIGIALQVGVVMWAGREWLIASEAFRYILGLPTPQQLSRSLGRDPGILHSYKELCNLPQPLCQL